MKSDWPYADTFGSQVIGLLLHYLFFICRKLHNKKFLKTIRGMPMLVRDGQTGTFLLKCWELKFHDEKSIWVH